MYQAEHFLTREQEQLTIDFYVKWRINNLRRYYEIDGRQRGRRERPAGRDDQGQHQDRGDAAHVAAGGHRRTRGVHRRDDEDRAALRATSWASSSSMCASPRSIFRSRSRIRCSSACARRSRRRPRSCAPRASRPRIASARRRTRRQTEILADASRQASETRGQGDASASEVYAKSYSKNAEFYSFYRSMQSYRDAVGTQGDLLVIAPDNAYFKYFNKPQPQPQPQR